MTLTSQLGFDSFSDKLSEKKEIGNDLWCPECVYSQIRPRCINTVSKQRGR